MCNMEQNLPIINEATMDAVEAFQAAAGLKVDGIAGQMTQAALYAQWEFRKRNRRESAGFFDGQKVCQIRPKTKKKEKKRAKKPRRQ